MPCVHVSHRGIPPLALYGLRAAYQVRTVRTTVRLSYHMYTRGELLAVRVTSYNSLGTYYVQLVTYVKSDLLPPPRLAFTGRRLELPG